MRFPRSIRFRLVVLYWLLSNVLVVAVLELMYFRLQRELNKVAYARIGEEVYEFLAAKHTDRAGLVRYARDSVDDENQAAQRPWLFFYACDFAGQEIARSATMPPGMMLASKEGFEQAKAVGRKTETVTHVHKYPVYCRSVRMALADGSPCVAQIGISLRDQTKMLENQRENMYIALGGFALASVLLGFLLAKWSFDPVSRITKTAESITAHDLSQRIPVPETNDEVARLCRAFNAMIERLERAFQTMRQFTADASHELRTPISILKGQMELVLESERKAEEYREALASCLEEMNKLSAIANSLLVLARHDAVQGDEKREIVSLPEVLKEVCEIGRIMAEGRNVRLTADGLDVEAPLWGNRQGLERIFMNLVDNAVRYNKDGGEARLALSLQDGNAVVVVTDTGLGIPQEELPLVFDRFYRGKHTRSQREGVGLGLSICKAVTEEHGGAISVESRLGEGSAFTVRLPLAQGGGSSSGPPP